MSSIGSVYYNNLGADRKIYDAAVQCFQRIESSFSVSGCDAPMEIAVAVLYDHPEFFYVSQQIRMASSFLSKELLPNYLYSPSQIAQLRNQLEAAAQAIIDECINEHQSEYDKVRALHDYLKSNLEYDMVAATSGYSIPEAHNLVGALIKHKCVCEGFAKAFKFLCDKVGIECWVVAGVGNSTLGTGPHGWNIVRINGYYHHVDVTWDNQYSDSSSAPNYGYLNLSDEEISKDHTWNRRNYPACPSSPYNYFKVNNALLDSRAQLESMLYNCFQMEESIIMFRVVRGSILEREINSCLSDSIQKAAHRCKYISVGSFRCASIPEQLTFCVWPTYRFD